MPHPERDLLCQPLQRVPYFAGLDTDALCELASLATWREYAPGAIIFLEGDANSGLYALVFAGLHVWILLPVLMAPLIILKVANIPGADIEANAPQALIYGWIGQFLYAVTPYFAARWLLRDPAARLGSNWFSLVTVNLGSALIWASIFLAGARNPRHTAAYVALAVSLVAAAWETGVITLAALHRAEQETVPAG